MFTWDRLQMCTNRNLDRNCLHGMPGRSETSLEGRSNGWIQNSTWFYGAKDSSVFVLDKTGIEFGS